MTNPITIRVTGNDTLSPQLSRFADLLSGPGRVRVLEAAADAFLKITWANFGATGQNRPIEWPALSPRYQRAIAYFGPPTLILEGELINSVRTLGMGDNWIDVGSDLPYASIHQHGEGWVPARPYFPVYDNGIDAELTPYADVQVRAAVETAVMEMMRA